MNKNEKELKFNQLVTKMIIGKFTIFEDQRRIIFLSKDILIAENESINFYDYKKYSRTLIMPINKKDKKYFKFSKLLNDKFCIYLPNETKIYQFNKKDFTVTLLKTINVNLNKLIEIDDNLFINITDYYFYIWKKLKPIFKWNSISFIILIMLLNLFFAHWLKHLRKIWIYLINFILATILLIIIKLYIHLLNPYKRIKNGFVYHLEKCGKNICCLVSRDYAGIFNYKSFEIIKKINFNDEIFFSFFIINENIIIFINKINQRIKIYDINSNKIINEFFNEFIIDYLNTFKINKNIYITCYRYSIIKWKYNFESNNICIISRNNFKCEEEIIERNFANKNLFILTKKLLHNGDYILSLFIYS